MQFIAWSLSHKSVAFDWDNKSLIILASALITLHFHATAPLQKDIAEEKSC